MLDKSIPAYDIFMYKDDTAEYPEYTLPEGFYFKAYEAGDEAQWADIECSLGQFDTPEEALQCFKNEFLVNQVLDAKKRVLFVMAPGGEYAGTIALWDGIFYGQRVDRVHWVAVKDKFAGRGIAKAMLTAVMDMYNDLGLSGRLQLWTGSRNYVAISLYKRFGFKLYRGNVDPRTNTISEQFARETCAGIEIVKQKLSEFAGRDR